MTTISVLISVFNAFNQNARTFLYSLSAEISQCQSGFPNGLTCSSYSILCKARLEKFVIFSVLSVDTYSIDSQIGIYFCRVQHVVLNGGLWYRANSHLSMGQTHQQKHSFDYKTDLDFQADVVGLVD